MLFQAQILESPLVFLHPQLKIHICKHAHTHIESLGQSQIQTK